MRGVLLTGLPGVGKTTASRKVADICKERGWRVEGFLTEELRQHRARVGFDVVELGGSGHRVPLARAGGPGPRVGKYGVTVAEFEALVLPILDRVAEARADEHVVCILDEIGKMELFSSAFVAKMRAILATRPVPLLVTIALHGGGFIAEAKRTRGVELVEIDQRSRDGAPADIATRLLAGSPCGGPRVGRGSSGGPASSGGDGSAAVQRSSRWQARDGVKGDGTSRGVAGSSSRWRARVPGDTQTVAPVERASEGKPVVLWFRCDLRLSDNPLVDKALMLSRSRGSSLLPVFCLDPRDFGAESRTPFGNPKVGPARRRFLEETLKDLSAALENRGSKLLVCEAAPDMVLPQVAGPGGLVIATQEMCPEERNAEARVAAALRKVEASLELLDTGGITTIFGTKDLSALGVRTGVGFPEDFKIFYDIARGAVTAACSDGLRDAPHEVPPPAQA